MEPPSTWISRFGATWWPGGQATWPVDRVDQPPSTRASPPRVDVWQPRLRSNRLKPWPAGWTVGPLGLGSSSLDPRVKYTPMLMMILTFGQL
jgi:hypothetical protein